jgi:hypothetical protein
MKYWEDFQTKWGFGDGDAVPPDAYPLNIILGPPAGDKPQRESALPTGPHGPKCSI